MEVTEQFRIAALKAWPLLVFLACAPASAPAATILDPMDAAVTAMDYEDLAALFPSVGRVDGNGFFDGSGVLIGDRWVLTAGHIGERASPATFTVGGAEYDAVQVVQHPDYSFSFGAAPHDLTLMELAIPVPNVTPSNMWRFSDPANILGEEATWVGFGIVGTGLTGQTPPGGHRAFTNIADFIGGFGLPVTSFVSDFDRPDGSENAAGSPSAIPTMLEGNLTPGDSGGGTFILRNGEYVLVGINSYSAALDGVSDGDYGDLSGSTNLNLYYDWIEQVTGITPIPEPRTAGLLGIAAALAAWRRRRTASGN